MSDTLQLTLGTRRFIAHLEAGAPLTAAWLLKRGSLEGVLQHGRWSGEAGWVPLGERPDVPFENAMANPSPGQLLLYPGDASVPEILVPYGLCRFACCDGPLAGNHFATVRERPDELRAIGEALLATGAMPFRIEAV